MNDRPSAAELLRAVERFLADEVVSELSGPRRYHARVAAHLVALVAREIDAEEAQLLGEWQRLGALLGDPQPPPQPREQLRARIRSRSEDLARRIRAGEADRGPWRGAVLAHLRATVADKLSVSRTRPGGG